MHSFSEARSLPLATDGDYGRFVDPAIGGADRVLAITLLKFMPPHMRGDFIYVNEFGRVLSNRAALVPMAHFVSASSLVVSHQTPIARTAKQVIRPMSYPPTGGSGGPFHSLLLFSRSECSVRLRELPVRFGV